MTTLKKPACGAVPARLSLALLTSAGVVVLYILRINMSVAIVAMVDLAPASQTPSSNNNLPYCTSTTQVNQSGVVAAGEGVQESTLGEVQEQGGHLTLLNTTEPSTLLDPQHEEESSKMVLTGTQRGLVLGAFFYGYAMTNIPGGRLAEMYGTKRVFGGAILIGGVLTLFTPLAARSHYIVLIFLRTLLGLSNGVVYPSLNAMVARWIPPLERPRFMSFTYMSNSIGTIVTMPVCGFLIAYVGWPSVFYFSGGVSLLWVVFWGFLMHDTPDQHPRISSEERDHIVNALNAEAKKEKPTRTPWRSIMASVPLWATTFAHIGSMFGFNLLLTQLPTYLATILGFSITNNGLVSALPFATQFVGSVGSGWIGDFLITRNYLTIRTSRKLFVTVTHALPGIILVLVGYTGCHNVQAIVLLCLATTFCGCICSGHLANHLDLSPNFAGTCYGVSNALAYLVTMCVPVIVGAMTPDQTLGQWQSVFWLTAGFYIVNWIIFLVFGSTDIQPWNYEQEGKKEDEEKTKEEAEKFIGVEEKPQLVEGKDDCKTSGTS